jgi:hypothetical protein
MGTPTGNFPSVDVIRAVVPAEGTAGTGGEYPAGMAEYASRISEVRYIPSAAVTGVASNNKAISVVNKGTAGSGTQSAAAITFGNGTNAAAFDSTNVPLDSTATNRDVPAGAVISVKSTVNGTGMTLPAGVVEIELTRD